MSKILIHIKSIVLALFFSVIIFYIFHDNFIRYYYKNQSNDKSPVANLQKDLESGVITIFGASDLQRKHLRFKPQNFFKNELNLPFRAVGQAFHTPFMMFSELSACESDDVKSNAKVVIIVSPTWFSWGSYQKGVKLPVFLKYMPPQMVYKLFVESPVDDKYKEFIVQYINEHKKDMKGSNIIYNYAKYYKHGTFKIAAKFLKNINISYPISSSKINPYVYVKPNLNYLTLEKEARDIEDKKKTNNTLGLEDKFYTKQKNKNKLTITLSKPRVKEKNIIFQDLLTLLELLKTYKNKPLFIIAELNPYVYQKKDIVSPIFKEVRDEIERNGFEYLNLYTDKKEDFNSYVLEDAQHFDEFAWLEINKKIIEHFMEAKK